MPKIKSTKLLLDKNSGQLRELYQDRCIVPLEELTAEAFADPETLKAVVEMRLYHLPCYFDVSIEAKLRVTGAAPALRDLRDYVSLTKIERELIGKFSNIFLKARRKVPCSECGRARPLIDGTCVVCMMAEIRDNWREYVGTLQQNYDARTAKIKSELCDPNLFSFAEKYPGYWAQYIGFFRNWTELREKLDTAASSSYGKTEDRPHGWTSPKTLLLASEIGCVHCETKYKPSWIWHDDDYNWDDGLCPACIPKYRENDGFWSYDPETEHRGNAYAARYDKCMRCGGTGPYALWGMCQECYQGWQDSYTDLNILWRLASEQGALATLLIRPDALWVTYVLGHLPKVRQSTSAGGPDLDILKPPVVRPEKPPKTLADLGIDVAKLIGG